MAGTVQLDLNLMKHKPWPHQLEGIKMLLRRPIFGLFWKMRLGKTLVVIATACFLFLADLLDICLIVLPAQVKDVWIDRDLGEILKHGFGEFVPRDFYKKTEDYDDYRRTRKPFFIVTSLEFLRQEDAEGNFPKVEKLVQQLKGKRVWLVVDEASAIGNHSSLQTRAVEELKAGLKPTRITELDGTPSGNSPMDLYAKAHLLDPGILGYKNFWHFRANHAIMGGFKKKQVVGFKNLDRITRLMKPHCWYMEQGELMPAKVPTFFTTALSEKSWKIYCDMRDDLIAELDNQTVTVNNAAAKVLRLAQICSGFLGGVDDEVTHEKKVVEVGDEATAGLLLWLKQRFAENPNFKAVIWCRFRPEIERLHSRLKKAFPNILHGLRYGGVEENIKQFHQDSDYEGPGILVGQPQSARFGYNFAKADTVIHLSRDYNVITWEQSEDRVQAKGIRPTTLVVDVLVTGPNGQKTITWDIVKSLREGEDIARRTSSQWKMVLQDGMRLNG